MKPVWALPLILIAVSGCGWLKFGRQPAKTITGGPPVIIDQTGWVPTGNDDLDTVAICLLDFMKQGRMTSLVDGRRSSIVINKRTNGPSDFISPEQIESDTRRMNIPPGAIASMQSRNTDVPEITWIPPGLPFFVADLSTLPVDLKEMAATLPTVYPNVFAAVWLWLPGYSADGNSALVRFTFAPTSSGAIATYLLIKDETGKWRIMNRGLKYFAEPQ